MASRDVVFDAASEAITVTGTGFDATQITFNATGGIVDYLGWGLASGEWGSESLVGSSGPTENNNGVMVINSGICTVTVPIALDMPVDVPLGTGNATYDGVLVATGAVPAEAVMAYAPSPSNAAVAVLPSSMLTWSSAYYAVSHQVYFGTNAAAVSNATVVSGEFMGVHAAASFNPGTLAMSTPYYWRVDEVATGGFVTEGEVWSFTTASILPFTETFEATDPGMAGALGNLRGQHGWEVTPADGAEVQDTEANGGDQACRITNAIVSHAFAEEPKRVDVECYVKPTFSPGPPGGVSDCAAAFWVDESGHVGGYDGATPRISTAVSLTEDTWVRFNIRADYHQQRWSLWANGVQAVTNFAFHSARAGFEAFKVLDEEQSTSFLDDINITAGPKGVVVLYE